MQKEFFELIARRESCRSFDLERPVEREKLEQCLAAARLAPSACNSQPWQFLAVTNRELIRQIGEAAAQKFTLSVPAFIVINETEASLLPRVLEAVKDSQHYAQIDIGIVTAHICLAASAQGLSSCIIGWFDEARLSEVLPPGQGKTRLLIAIGYAAEGELREKRRKPLAEISTFIE